MVCVCVTKSHQQRRGRCVESRGRVVQAGGGRRYNASRWHVEISLLKVAMRHVFTCLPTERAALARHAGERMVGHTRGEVKNQYRR